MTIRVYYGKTTGLIYQVVIRDDDDKKLLELNAAPANSSDYIFFKEVPLTIAYLAQILIDPQHINI
jgi:hypothetical protein